MNSTAAVLLLTVVATVLGTAAAVPVALRGEPGQGATVALGVLLATCFLAGLVVGL